MGLVLVRRDFRVGQGGFSAIKILDRGRKIFSVIYDCGSVTSRDKFCETDIFNEFEVFNENHEIDLVVFSHLDLDHVNMGGRLMTDYSVKNVALPYLSRELVWCFLRTTMNSKYQAVAKGFCDDLYLKETIGRDGCRVFYNIGAGRSLGEIRNDDRQPEEQGADNFTIEYRSREVALQGVAGKVSVLDDVVFKRSGHPSRIELLIMLFQPHYHEMDNEAFRLKAEKYVPKNCHSLDQFKAKDLKKFYYKNIHSDLNKTSIGLFVSLRSPNNRYFIEQHAFTGDMTVNKHAIDFLITRLSSNIFFNKHYLCFRMYKNINVQLPHHGSKHSIDLRNSTCRWILRNLKISVMHGRNRKNHPSLEVVKRVTRLIRILETGKGCSKSHKRRC